MKQFVTREHENEPVVGLPGKLPAGEHIVWQGKPNSRLVGRRVLKMRWIGGYFVLLALWAVIAGFYDGRTLGGIVFSAGILGLLGTVLIGMLELFAWGVEKTTLYTITNKRIVMRIGVALSMTLNLPFEQIASASVIKDKDGNGGVAIALKPGHKMSWLLQWPHVRTWKFAEVEPSLICLNDVEKVASLLGDQLRLHSTEGLAQRVELRGGNAGSENDRPVVVAAE